MQFVFRGSNGALQVCLLTNVNKAQFDAGFAHRLILKDEAAIKDPGHDLKLQVVSETASNVCVLLAIGAQVHVSHYLSPRTRLQDFDFIQREPQSFIFLL